jgi:hypothetical protein
MDLYQQAANAIAGLRDLACQVFIKAAQHCELRNLVGGQFHRSQGARHTAGRPGDDVRVPRRSWLRRRAKSGGEPVETASPRARTNHRGIRNGYKRSTHEITLDQRHRLQLAEAQRDVDEPFILHTPLRPTIRGSHSNAPPPRGRPTPHSRPGLWMVTFSNPPIENLLKKS